MPSLATETQTCPDTVVSGGSPQLVLAVGWRVAEEEEGYSIRYYKTPRHIESCGTYMKY